MTAPWAEASVEASLDYGDIDEDLRRRLTQSVAVATRACQRHFDGLEKHAKRQAQQTASHYEREFGKMRRDAERTGQQIRRALDTDVSVQLHIDSTQAFADLRRVHAQMQTWLDRNPLQVRLDIDNDSVTRLIRDLDRVQQTSQRLGGQRGNPFADMADGAAKASLSFAKWTGLAGAAVVSVGSLVPLVSALGAGLFAVGGAAAGAGVAGLTAVAATTATLKVAFAGMGEAFKNAFDPEQADKFNEALAKLAPQAQSTVLAVQGLVAEWKNSGAQLAVQDALFAGLGDRLAALDRYLPAVRDAMLTIADGFNEGAKSALAFMDSTAGFQSLSAILAGAANIGANFGSALGNLLPGLAAVAQGALAVFSPMTDGIAGATRSLSDFLVEAQQSGQIADFFRNAVDLATQFGQVLGTVGSILGGVFRAASAAGGGDLLGGLLQSLRQVSEFANSAGGQNALTTFFTSAREAMGAIVPVFLKVVEVIGTQVAPIIAELAKTLGPALTPAIEAIGRGISQTAPQITGLGDAFADIIRLVTPILPMLIQLAPTIVGIAGAFKLWTTATKAITAAQTLMNIAMRANPIILIGTLVAGLAVALWAFFTKTETGRKIWDTVWNGIKSALSTAWEFIKPIFEALKNAVKWVGDAAVWLWQNAIVPAWDGIKRAIGVAWDIIKGIFDAWKSAIDKVVEVVMWLWNNAVVPAFDGIKNAISAAWDFISPIYEHFKRGFQRIGDAAVGFKDIVAGAFNWVKDVASSVWDTLSSIFSKIESGFNAVKGIISKIPGLGFLGGHAGGGLIAGYATGGPVKDYRRGGRTSGPGTGTSDSILSRLSDGEYVEPERVVNRRTLPILEAIRRGWTPSPEFVRAVVTGDYRNTRNGDLAGLLPGFAGGGQVSADQLVNFARGVEGKPYEWGGVNWGDCSGAVSAIANYATGRDPFGSRFATASEAGELAARGFQPGLGPAGSLNVGWYNGGPYGGHTAATLPDGTNFEMGGARGDGQFGGQAAGANHPDFTDHAHLPPEYFGGLDAGAPTTATPGVDLAGSPFGSGGGGGSSGGASYGNAGGTSSIGSAAAAKSNGITPVWVENWPAAMVAGGGVPTGAYTAGVDAGAPSGLSAGSDVVPSAGDVSGEASTAQALKSQQAVTDAKRAEAAATEKLRVAQMRLDEARNAPIDGKTAKARASQSAAKSQRIQTAQRAVDAAQDAVDQAKTKTGQANRAAQLGDDPTREARAELAAAKARDAVAAATDRQEQAEAKLDQVRGDPKSSPSEIAAAEAAVSKARDKVTSATEKAQIAETAIGEARAKDEKAAAKKAATEQNKMNKRQGLNESLPSSLTDLPAYAIRAPLVTSIDDRIAATPGLLGGYDNSKAQTTIGSRVGGVADAFLGGQLGAVFDTFGYSGTPPILSAISQYQQDNPASTGAEDGAVTKNLTDLVRDLPPMVVNIYADGKSGKQIAQEVDAARKRRMRRYIGP